jgi:hypothetical protein
MAMNFEHVVVAERWEVNPHNMEVGRSQLGTHQIVATLADKWTAQIRIKTVPQDISDLRGWRTTRRGRFTTDPFGPTRFLAGSADGHSFGQSVPHDDGAFHDDGTGYGQGYEVAIAAAVRATQMTVNAIDLIGLFGPGRFFGIGGRLYQITALDGESSTQVRFNFWPPLRAAVAAGETFDWPPRTDMRLDADFSGEIEDPETGAVTMTLTMQEVL